IRGRRRGAWRHRHGHSNGGLARRAHDDPPSPDNRRRAAMSTDPARAFAARFGWPAATMTFPLAIAHRGASGHATENTLAAFARAADLGAEMWELDTQLTKDGVCVVSHDDHLQPVFGLD